MRLRQGISGIGRCSLPSRVGEPCGVARVDARVGETAAAQGAKNDVVVRGRRMGCPGCVLNAIHDVRRCTVTSVAVARQAQCRFLFYEEQRCLCRVRAVTARATIRREARCAAVSSQRVRATVGKCRDGAEQQE